MNPMTLKETLEDSIVLSNYLRDLSKEEIISFYRVREDAGGLIDIPNVIPDGIIIPEEGIFESYINGKFQDKEIILGTNRDEHKLFMSGNPRFVKTVLPKFISNLHPTLGLWTKQRNEKFYDAYSRYQSDAWKLDAVDNASRYISKINKNNVYAYRFDWDDEPKFLGMNFSKLLGAAHALEIGFVFNSPEIIDGQESGLSDILYKKENAIFDKNLSISMSQYWVNFAYDGNPNSNPYSLEVKWDHWENKINERFIIFDTENDQGIRMNNAILSEDSILQNLSSENLSIKQKCIIFDDLFDRTTLSKKVVSSLYDNFLHGKCI
jgi:para-nitrobenzyl esterase